MRTEQVAIRQQMDDQAAAQGLLRVEAEVADKPLGRQAVPE